MIIIKIIILYFIQIRHTDAWFPLNGIRLVYDYNPISSSFNGNDIFLDINSKLDLESQKQNQKEFLGLIIYRKVVSYTIYSIVDRLKLLIISRFVYVANTKSGPKVSDANKAQHIPEVHVDAFQSKHLAIANTSGFTFWQLDYPALALEWVLQMLLQCCWFVCQVWHT